MKVEVEYTDGTAVCGVYSHKFLSVRPDMSRPRPPQHLTLMQPCPTCTMS